MYQRIVVGTDGSLTAERAVQVAGGLALLTGAALHVVSAYKPARIAALVCAGGGNPRYGEEDRLAAKAVLDQALACLPPASMSATTTICRLGDAADVLLTVAEEVAADLLVIGNRAVVGVRRCRLGAVADRVAHLAPCSVHIVNA